MPRGNGPGPRGPYMNRTHCKYGHAFTEENTYWFVKGNTSTRICRTCNKEKSNFRARLYGMSKDRYLELVNEQAGVCAICGGRPGERALAVDHDHATGQIRSLLCTRCNIGIGGFRDDPTLLQRALIYLERWKTEAKS